MERLRFVLGCEVKWDTPLGRYPNELYDWAYEMNIHESYGKMGVRTRPEYLAGLIAELRQSEQINTPPARGRGGEQGGTGLKSKPDFYIAFYERLALAGFQAVVDFTKENLADICFKGYNFAHLTKTDHVIPNPNAEVPLGAMEQLQHILKETALKFAVCDEKPYDETKHYEFSDGSYKLAEYDGMVLACGRHHLFGYLFYTFKFPNEIGQPDERETFFAKSDAARDFAVKSGLIDERRLFTDAEVSVIQNGLIKLLMTPDNNLDTKAVNDIEAVITKTEDAALGGLDMSSSLEYEDEMSEGVEQ
jgi:hypothetical protein